MYSDEFDRNIIEAMIVCVNDKLVKNTQVFYFQSDEDFSHVFPKQRIRTNMERIIGKAQCRKILFTIRDDFVGSIQELIYPATGQPQTSLEYALVEDNIAHSVCSS